LTGPWSAPHLGAVWGVARPVSEPPPKTYVFGHAPQEMARLEAQARIIDPITRRFFVAAGIAPGMRVLDCGSGAGDVAFLAADLVGETGAVVGTDRSAAALTTARRRAEGRRLGNVSFVEGDPAGLAFDQPFDAVLGRYVLEFQPDPAAMLRGVAAHVKPGGIVVFHELDCGTASSYPPSPTHDRVWRWWMELLAHNTADPRIGLHLYETFVRAGLSKPSLRQESIVVGGSMAAEYLRVGVADLMMSVGEDMERFCIATIEEIDYPTLADRMIAEVIANNSVIIGRAEVGAWVRV
jgi:ubiquinone/menaquinone biosynthesis C-methylase UbiE